MILLPTAWPSRIPISPILRYLASVQTGRTLYSAPLSSSSIRCRCKVVQRKWSTTYQGLISIKRVPLSVRSLIASVCAPILTPTWSLGWNSVSVQATIIPVRTLSSLILMRVSSITLWLPTPIYLFTTSTATTPVYIARAASRPTPLLWLWATLISLHARNSTVIYSLMCRPYRAWLGTLNSAGTSTGRRPTLTSLWSSYPTSVRIRTWAVSRTTTTVSGR